MERIISRLVINSILVLLNINCFAAQIGSVTTHEKNPAAIVRNKEIIQISKGSGVEMNDVINTEKSIIGITFEDKTTVNVTENSKLVIDDFVYDPNKSVGKLGLKVALGTVRYASGAIAHNNPDSVSIKTPTSTIAVRGTDFVMSVDEIGRSTIILLPECKSDGICVTGVIDVETPAGIVTMAQSNQATTVSSTVDPPTPPITLELSNTPLNNNLMVSAPKTTSGAPLQMKSSPNNETKTTAPVVSGVAVADSNSVVAISDKEDNKPQKQIVQGFTLVQDGKTINEMQYNPNGSNISIAQTEK